jgi:hypothetical protein
MTLYKKTKRKLPLNIIFKIKNKLISKKLIHKITISIHNNYQKIHLSNY